MDDYVTFSKFITKPRLHDKLSLPSCCFHVDILYFTALGIGHFRVLLCLKTSLIMCETFHMKMSSTCSFFFMQIKVIFIRMVSHLDSLWNRGARELGNGLLVHDKIYILHYQNEAWWCFLLVWCHQTCGLFKEYLSWGMRYQPFIHQTPEFFLSPNSLS